MVEDTWMHVQPKYQNAFSGPSPAKIRKPSVARHRQWHKSISLSGTFQCKPPSAN